jgi:hypothetical protein
MAEQIDAAIAGCKVAYVPDAHTLVSEIPEAYAQLLKGLLVSAWPVVAQRCGSGRSGSSAFFRCRAILPLKS